MAWNGRQTQVCVWTRMTAHMTITLQGALDIRLKVEAP